MLAMLCRFSCYKFNIIYECSSFHCSEHHMSRGSVILFTRLVLITLLIRFQALRQNYKFYTCMLPDHCYCELLKDEGEPTFPSKMIHGVRAVL